MSAEGMCQLCARFCVMAASSSGRPWLDALRRARCTRVLVLGSMED